MYWNCKNKKGIWAAFTKRVTAQKMNFSIKDVLSKCDQIRKKLQIWSKTH